MTLSDIPIDSRIKSDLFTNATAIAVITTADSNSRGNDDNCMDVVVSTEIDTKCNSTTDNVNFDGCPRATRKRTAQHRPDFVQVDAFVASKKKTKTKDKKAEIEEEFATTWICVECKEAECLMEPNATDLLICDGVCRRVFHYPCAGLLHLPSDDEPFICTDCSSMKHACSLCSNYGYDNEDVFKCSKPNCGLFYHVSCLSMRNVDVTTVARNLNNDNNEKQEQYGDDVIEDDDVEIDGAVMKENRPTRIVEYRFVCPAHSCWTCTQIDLKDQQQQNDTSDVMTIKKAKNKNKLGSTFEAKKEKFLTRCLECPISYHVSCIPPVAKFHELATLCHEHSQQCKLPHLDPNDSLQIRIENKIDQQFGDFIKKDTHRKRKKCIGQNPFIPNISGATLTTSESEVLAALKLHNDNTDDNTSTKTNGQIWFCLPCDIKAEVHSKLPTYKHVHALQYSPNRKPPRIPPQDDICNCMIACDENCINRMLYTECYGDKNATTKNGSTKSSNCAVGGNCGNRQIGQRLIAKCKPQREHGKGWGLVVLKNACQGDLIQEYVGEVVDEISKEKRLHEWYNEHPNDPNFYLMALQPGWFIDARDVANLSRFINHSCDPNCVLQQINVNGRMRCGIYALRDIVAGECLSYDYQFDTRHGDRFICCCGSKNCRGTMKGGKNNTLSSDNMDSRKSKAAIWEDAKANYERDKKFLTFYEEDYKKRCTQVGAIVPGGDTDEYVANGANERKYRLYGQQQRIFLWRNVVLGNNFERRLDKARNSLSNRDLS